MAILNQLQIRVRSGGRILPEHEIPADDEAYENDLDQPNDENRIYRYIEAIPGADYQIVANVEPRFAFGQADYLSVRLYIDGKRSGATHLTKDDLSRTISGSHTTMNGVWKKLPFRWAQLITDEEKPTFSMAELKSIYKELGELRLEVWRKTGKETRPSSPTTFTLDDEPVPEKALKGRAIDLSTTSGTPQEMRRPHTRIGRALDAFPLAEFVFKYRSKRALQIIGVLPRTPTPVPLEDRDPDDLTREEAVELLRRQKVCWYHFKIMVCVTRYVLLIPGADMFQQAQAAIQIKKEDKTNRATGKRAASEGDDDDDFEITAGPSKKARHEIEIVDLTND
jgi:hypothetical protein